MARTVVNVQFVPGVQEILRHGDAHFAELYKTDFHAQSVDTAPFSEVSRAGL